MLEPGAVLHAERYRIVRQLGAGGQATTFEAVDAREGRPVAIKRFAVRGAPSWKEVELAEREARVLESLDHPLVPRFVEHFEEEGALYLVTELVEGESLQALGKRGRHLSRDDVLDLLRDLASALRYLHGRAPPVIHRDIKPGNVMRRKDGRFVLVDFGAVRAKLDTDGGSTVVGTFGYMAPEQFQGRALPQTDVYAAGATALAVLTGKDPGDLPHQGLRVDVRAALGGSDGELGRVLAAMLEPDPSRRPAEIEPLLARLRKARGKGRGRDEQDRASHQAAGSARAGGSKAAPDDDRRARYAGAEQAWRDAGSSFFEGVATLERQIGRVAKDWERKARDWEAREAERAARPEEIAPDGSTASSRREAEEARRAAGQARHDAHRSHHDGQRAERRADKRARRDAKRARHEARLAEARARRAHRGVGGHPPLALVRFGLWVARAAVAVAVIAFVPALLTVLSLLFGPGMRRAAGVVRDAGRRANGSMRDVEARVAQRAAHRAQRIAVDGPRVRVAGVDTSPANDGEYLQDEDEDEDEIDREARAEVEAAVDGEALAQRILDHASRSKRARVEREAELARRLKKSAK